MAKLIRSRTEPSVEDPSMARKTKAGSALGASLLLNLVRVLFWEARPRFGCPTPSWWSYCGMHLQTTQAAHSRRIKPANKTQSVIPGLTLDT